MSVYCVTADDWAEFAKRFPSAWAWLGRASLVGELSMLRARKRPNGWERTRLAELEEWERRDKALAG